MNSVCQLLMLMSGLWKAIGQLSHDGILAERLVKVHLTPKIFFR